MKNINQIFVKLPGLLKQSIEALPSGIIDTLEEIHIQVNSPVLMIAGNREIKLSLDPERITHELLDNVLSSLMDYSVYAYEEELSRGFITIEGGHRVGICGRVVKNGNINVIKDISSVNIRKSREIKGAADAVIKDIFNDDGLQNTIIVSPPKCGKTTLLRDIVRNISNCGIRVGLCDERSEIAGMYQGIPSFDIGIRTDVLDSCSKAEGMIMLIRSMSPDVIVTDEIGTDSDINAIGSAVCAGVKLITTIHGNDYDDLMRSKLGPLITGKVFTRIIFLTNVPSTGTIREVVYV